MSVFNYKNSVKKFKKLMSTYKRCITKMSLKGYDVEPLLFADVKSIPLGKNVPIMEESDEMKNISFYCRSLLFILNCMPKQEKMILWKEYAERDVDWWKNSYSKSTYYRLKKKAVEDFFTILDKDDDEKSKNNN